MRRWANFDVMYGCFATNRSRCSQTRKYKTGNGLDTRIYSDLESWMRFDRVLRYVNLSFEQALQAFLQFFLQPGLGIFFGFLFLLVDLLLGDIQEQRTIVDSEFERIERTAHIDR